MELARGLKVKFNYMVDDTFHKQYTLREINHELICFGEINVRYKPLWMN